ncbi:unnamed protein product, partial [Mesorhabditis belari]|uniref:Uncharacterized protein n=1 Tax=Mesorhabditis belari TaxID=2138241 RepID=A0AAF3FRA4_9BILA
MIIAGNTTKLAQSAVLLNAPLACHHGMANITFNPNQFITYWLTISTNVEVMAVRPEPRRGHLMVIERGKADCHFLKESGHVCSALIPAVKQPYRLAIRAFNLRDNTVGSMVLINNITVKADLCNESPFPLLFNSVPFEAPSTSSSICFERVLECIDPIKGCR